MGAYGSPELQGQENMKDLKRCKRCGEYFYKGWKRCPNCGKVAGGGAKGCLVAILSVVGAFILMIIMMSIIFGGNEVTQTIEEPVISKEEYIAKCDIFDYEEISRYPDNYVGKYAKFSGEVVQVMESGKRVEMRLSVEYDEEKWEHNIVYVSYTKKDENEARILEGDKITIYGQLDGIQKYTAIFGNEISIPSVKVEHIILN